MPLVPILFFSTTMKRSILLLLLLGTPLLAAENLTVDRDRGEVRITAIVQPDAMTRWFGVQGHHAIVWTEGRSARWALFRSLASDHDVRAALESLGARPGENLTVETWTERENEASSEPDKRVEGTPVEVCVEWPGAGRLPLSELIRQEGTPSPRFDFRYGGNESHQPVFGSGCIVCLYSCPGGAIGNHSRTIRDYEQEGVIYFARPDRLPAEGTHVTLILTPLEEP
jgi:hypothetical protein